MRDALETGLILPVMAQTALTFIVLLRAYVDRVAEVRARRIPLQALSRPAEVQATLRHTQAMDNFNNLLQLPLLFCVLCLAATVAGLVSPALVALAWAYVALRCLHSAVQVTGNRVAWRFAVFTASNLSLFLLFATLLGALVARV